MPVLEIQGILRQCITEIFTIFANYTLKHKPQLMQQNYNKKNFIHQNQRMVKTPVINSKSVFFFVTKNSCIQHIEKLVTDFYLSRGEKQRWKREEFQMHCKFFFVKRWRKRLRKMLLCNLDTGDHLLSSELILLHMCL